MVAVKSLHVLFTKYRYHFSCKDSSCICGTSGLSALFEQSLRGVVLIAQPEKLMADAAGLVNRVILYLRQKIHVTAIKTETCRCLNVKLLESTQNYREYVCFRMMHQCIVTNNLATERHCVHHFIRKMFSWFY